MTLQEALWLFFGGVIGVLGACAVAYAIISIERVLRLRAASSTLNVQVEVARQRAVKLPTEKHSG